MTYKITIQPSAEPVTLDQAKLQCRVEHAEEDTLITALIKSARELAEHRTQRAFITRTGVWTADRFCGNKIAFPVSPVQSITSITYVDANGDEQTIDSSVYVLDNSGDGKHYLRLKYGQSWPSVRDQFDAFKVTFVAGYGTADAVPAAVKQWMLLAIDAYYKNRGLISDAQTYELPEGFCAGLLNTVKIWGL